MNILSKQNSGRLDAADIINFLTAGSQATVIFSSRELHIGFINDAMRGLWNKQDITPLSRLIDVAPEFESLIPVLEKVWDSGSSYSAANNLIHVLHDGKLIPKAFNFEYQPVVDDDGKTMAIIISATEVTEEYERLEEAKMKIGLQSEDIKTLHASNKQHKSNNEVLTTVNDQLEALNEEYLVSNERLNVTLEELADLNRQSNESNEELERLNDQLSFNRAQLSNALQAASLGSFDLDLASGRMECSDQCKINFGREVDKRFDYSDLKATILPEFLTSFDQQVGNAIHNKTSFNIEYQICRPDESIHWIQVNGTPQYDSDGNPARIIGVTQVITERRNYQSRKDEFLSVASHELKTPITVLKANLQLLDKLKTDIENPKAHKLIESCNRSMERISVMLSELLDAGRYADGKMDLHLTSFRVDTFLNEALSQIKEEERERIEIDADPIELIADEKRLEQVIFNFINNAHKYAATSEKVIVAAKKTDGGIRFSVQDFGQGIARENLSRLFDRYWQGNKEQKNSDGMGLGLYICSEIINRHKGKIGAESQLGEGSTFWFEVPLSQA